MQEQDLDITAALVRMAGLISDIRALAAEEQDLSVQQATVLCVLARGARPMARLGSLMRINKSSVTWLIGRAEEAGLVRRRTDTRDRRSQLVELTERGSALGEKFRARVTELVDELIAGLDVHERDSVRKGLSRVVLSSQAETTWPSVSSAA